MSAGIRKEIKEIFYKNRASYVLSFVILVVSFVFLYTSVSMVYNITKYNNKLERSYNMKVYINNNVSDKNIAEMEKGIREIPKVEGISYISKERALAKLTKQLGLGTTTINNPLLNVFKVDVKGEVSLEETKEEVEGLDGVKEVIINEREHKEINKMIARNKKVFLYLLGITLIPLGVIIFSIGHGALVSQKVDIESKKFLGMGRWNILKPYYLIAKFKFLSAGILGGLIYGNLYILIKRELSEIVWILPIQALTLVLGATLLSIVVIFPLISFLLIKVER